MSQKNLNGSGSDESGRISKEVAKMSQKNLNGSGSDESGRISKEVAKMSQGPASAGPYRAQKAAGFSP
jgi:hypothetical protein